ncbi:hypothetical protein T4C_4690 [Trichinella pseudospiralis]|uniref:Uncharacterized protein n=1 Tax=Trichinella pseudospiralis TaxID=6337 RepID=A0A0V1IU69_TRIPS|nr:hypothetical protein T4C_4690 [Trichinella pseudospiralis]
MCSPREPYKSTAYAVMDVTASDTVKVGLSNELTFPPLRKSIIQSTKLEGEMRRSDPRSLLRTKHRLNQLLAELEELCLESADVGEIKEQISLTEKIYHESDALQGELLLDLDGEERQSAVEDWSKWRKLFRQRKSRACAIIEEAHGN